MKPLPSVEYLRECFSYDSETGELTWKRRPKEHFLSEREWKIVNTRCAGTIAGTIGIRGYRVIRVGNVRYRAHRIVWKLVTGDEPPESIDHIDGNTDSNRFVNLREATVAEQKWNSRLNSKNTSGRRGVYRFYDKWQAQIGINGKTHCLGTFNTADEASAAYEDAARKLHGHFYRESKV